MLLTDIQEGDLVKLSQRAIIETSNFDAIIQEGEVLSIELNADGDLEIRVADGDSMLADNWIFWQDEIANDDGEIILEANQTDRTMEAE